MSHLQPVVGILRRCVSRKEGVVVNTVKKKYRNHNEYETAYPLVRRCARRDYRISDFTKFPPAKCN